MGHAQIEQPSIHRGVARAGATLVPRAGSEILPSQQDAGNSPFFTPEGRETTCTIARLGIKRTFVRGEYLYREGEIATSMYYPLKGRIRVSMSGIDGSDRILAFAGPHTTVGEYGIFDDEPRYTSAVAVEDSRVLVIDRAAILAAGRANPEIFVELARKLAQRERLACMHIMYGGLSARVRVATLFVQLLNAYGVRETNNTARLSKSHRVEDCAHLVGVTRVTMSRELARFIEDGILMKSGREICIANIAALRAVAGTSGLVQ